jgi:UDP-glucose 4-epimerase
MALRYFNAAGAWPDGSIGEDHGHEIHLIPLAIRAATGGAPLKVFGEDYPTPDGTCLRDYIHVTDLAEAHILAARALDGGAPKLQLNLGTGEGRTVRQVLNAVAKATGRPVPHEIAPRRPGDAVALYSDTTASRSALGWTPRLSDIDTIVSTAWAFHKTKWSIPKAAE